MSTDFFIDWSQRQKWAAADDRLQAESGTGYALWQSDAPPAETEAALREEIQAQAEVIAAQDWQIQHMKDDHAELLVALDDKDRLLGKMQRVLDFRDAYIEKLKFRRLDALRQEQQAATFGN